MPKHISFKELNEKTFKVISFINA